MILASSVRQTKWFVCKKSPFATRDVVGQALKTIAYRILKIMLTWGSSLERHADNAWVHCTIISSNIWFICYIHGVVYHMPQSLGATQQCCIATWKEQNHDCTHFWANLYQIPICTAGHFGAEYLCIFCWTQEAWRQPHWPQQPHTALSINSWLVIEPEVLASLGWPKADRVQSSRGQPCFQAFLRRHR